MKLSKKIIDAVIRDYETNMEDLGYATLESWKMLRDELDNRLYESVRRMIRGRTE